MVLMCYSASKVPLVKQKALYKSIHKLVSYLIVRILLFGITIGHRGNQHHTHVANGTGEKIQVEIKHDGGTTKRFLEKDEVHCEKTSHTSVLIIVLGDRREMLKIPSDYSVVIKRTPNGLFKISSMSGNMYAQERDTYCCLF